MENMPDPKELVISLGLGAMHLEISKHFNLCSWLAVFSKAFNSVLTHYFLVFFIFNYCGLPFHFTLNDAYAQTRTVVIKDARCISPK
jgi:hypothetical protein